MTATTDRLEQLEAEMERLKLAKAREHDIDQQVPAPAPSLRAQERDRAQEAARQARMQAAAEAGRVYQEQLARVRPRTAKLEKQIRELGQQAVAEEERHAAAVANLAAERHELNRKLGELMPARADDQPHPFKDLTIPFARW